MSITLKALDLVEKLKIQKFFVEKDDRVLLNISFQPSSLETLIDKVLRSDGNKYKPNTFEQEVINELDRI